MALILLNVKQWDSWLEGRKQQQSHLKAGAHRRKMRRPLQRSTVATECYKKNEQIKNFLSQLTTSAFMVFYWPGQPLISAVKTSFGPATANGRSTPLIITLHSEWSLILPFQQRLALSTTFDSYDGCGTKRPISGREISERQEKWTNVEPLYGICMEDPQQFK